MHPLVADYLKTQEQKSNIDTLETKNDLLLKLGLYEKEYSDDAVPSAEYQNWDDIAQKYYRAVPVSVTDEEYAEILKYQKKDPSVPDNTIAVIFKVIGYFIFVIGFIIGIILGASTISGDFSFVVALTYWGVSFISGMVFLGFAEIIQLLTEIKNKK